MCAAWGVRGCACVPECAGLHVCTPWTLPHRLSSTCPRVTQHCMLDCPAWQARERPGASASQPCLPGTQCQTRSPAMPCRAVSKEPEYTWRTLGSTTTLPNPSRWKSLQSSVGSAARHSPSKKSRKRRPRRKGSALKASRPFQQQKALKGRPGGAGRGDGGAEGEVRGWHARRTPSGEALTWTCAR